MLAPPNRFLPSIHRAILSIDQSEFLLYLTCELNKRYTPQLMNHHRLFTHSFMTILVIACLVSCEDPVAYSVVYDGNGAASGSVPVDTGAYKAEATVTVLDNTGGLAKTGYIFSGWNTAADGTGTNYVAGASLTIASSDVTLYAQWTKNLAVTIGVPGTVTVTLTTKSSVAVGSTITASVATSTTVDSYRWYLDGAIVTGQTTDTFSGGSNLTKGPHTLMVAVKKNAIIYSASSGIKVQ
jgi:uncharacterized repeat protein (TIGR02543 family)